MMTRNARTRLAAVSILMLTAASSQLSYATTVVLQAGVADSYMGSLESPNNSPDFTIPPLTSPLLREFDESGFDRSLLHTFDLTPYAGQITAASLEVVVKPEGSADQVANDSISIYSLNVAQSSAIPVAAAYFGTSENCDRSAPCNGVSPLEWRSSTVGLPTSFVFNLKEFPGDKWDGERGGFGPPHNIQHNIPHFSAGVYGPSGSTIDLLPLMNNPVLRKFDVRVGDDTNADHFRLVLQVPEPNTIEFVLLACVLCMIRLRKSSK